MSYMTISSQEKHNFSLCSCFHAHPTTLLLKILEGPMHGRSPPPQILGEPSPESPLGLRPCHPLFLHVPFNLIFLPSLGLRVFIPPILIMMHLCIMKYT